MKISFLVASMMMLSTCAFAQHEVGSLTIQPKIGMNIANYNSSDDTDPRFGLAIGAELEHQVSDKTGLSIGLLYSMQGAKTTGNIDGSIAKMTAKTDYINIPVLANLYVFNGLAFKLGIQPGFNIKADYNVSVQNVNVNVKLSDAGVNINSFDFAIPVGLSYEYNNIVIECRYNIGITEMVDDDDTKNSVFQFTLGYKFGL